MSENENALLADPADRLLGFASRLRRRHALAAARSAAVVTALLLAIPAIAVAWSAPSLRLPVAAIVVVVVGFAALVGLVRSSRVANEALLRSDAGDAVAMTAVVGDELATWLEVRRGTAADPPMVGWLGRDVVRRLPALPADAIVHAGRRPLGRVRWLVPIVLLLVLAWILAEWLAPPWPGALGGGSGSGNGGGGGGGGATEGEGNGNGQGTPPPQQPRPDEPQQPNERRPDERPPTQPPPPEPEKHEAETKPEEPAPMLELPEQQRFVVPEFVGDGPTRRARMHAAQVERDGGARPQAAGTEGNDGNGQVPPPPAKEQFERAAEAAQRARHVPDEERAMVQRFFQLLRERAK